jgi:glycosyltransferase involved in cell wall biosynthesis
MAGVPVAIHTEHGRRAPDPWSDRMIDSIAARHSDHVVAVSDALARHLNVLVGVPERKVSVIVNGVETNAFLPDRMQLRRELGIAPHMHVIGSVGRLEPVKGYDVALRALAQLDRTDVVLVIAGDGSERERLQMLASSLGVARRVFFLGWRNDVELLHAASDIFSMSSHSEGTSVSLLEAMAAGKCPVVTTVGGNAAVLGSKLRHRLVKPNDAVALALAWRAALDDGARTTRDGAAARVRVAAQFSVERMVRSYEELYVSPNWQRRREAMQHAGRP